jgi:hypothetical protein
MKDVTYGVRVTSTTRMYDANALKYDKDATGERIRQRKKEDYEKARRMLIYRHMIGHTGKIHYDLIHQWLYQPSEAEILEMLSVLAGLACAHCARRKQAEARAAAFDAARTKLESPSDA